MDKLALPDNLAAWQDRFKQIEERAEAAWAKHLDAMLDLAVDLEEIRQQYSDAVLEDFRGKDDFEDENNLELADARENLYRLSGYFAADAAVGVGAHGDPY